ncbi:MAG TPA: hypothetical protein VKI45_05660 [Allosphingosinicella sp.]|nr:hypothetical protein [Allosphingosinicella sp.]
MEIVGWLVGLAIAALVLGPFAVTLVRRLRHQQRRRMVDAPRKISIVGNEGERCADDRHIRDRARVRHDGRGGYRTFCSRCGAPLARTHHGSWQAVED